ncbi:unnamed protein product, partial [Hapterophycus canaliculatus]
RTHPAHQPQHHLQKAREKKEAREVRRIQHRTLSLSTASDDFLVHQRLAAARVQEEGSEVRQRQRQRGGVSDHEEGQESGGNDHPCRSIAGRNWLVAPVPGSRGKDVLGQGYPHQQQQLLQHNHHHHQQQLLMSAYSQQQHHYNPTNHHHHHYNPHSAPAMYMTQQRQRQQQQPWGLPSPSSGMPAASAVGGFGFGWGNGSSGFGSFDDADDD